MVDKYRDYKLEIVHSKIQWLINNKNYLQNKKIT